MRLCVQGGLAGGSDLLDEGPASLALIADLQRIEEQCNPFRRKSLGPGGRTSVLRHTEEDGRGGPEGCGVRGLSSIQAS